MPKIVEVIKGCSKMGLKEFDKKEIQRCINELLTGREPGYYMFVLVPYRPRLVIRLGGKRGKEFLWEIVLVGQWNNNTLKDVKELCRLYYIKDWIILKVWKSRRGRKVRV